MLRFAFLPSDFHPMLLVLGEAPDLAAFAALLRRFAADPAETRLEAQAFVPAADGTALRLTPEGEPPGAWREDGPGRHPFRWTLGAAQAEAFADLVDGLADPACAAGSEVLEVGVRGEMPVKVSRGEYTDDFLARGPAP